MDKMSKKKAKISLDSYRFQKLVAKMNGGRLVKDGSLKGSNYSQTLDEIDNSKGYEVTARKVKKDRKRQEQHRQNIKESNTKVVQNVYDEEKVDEIISIDEDCTRGMRRKVKKDGKRKKQHLQNINESNTEVVQSVNDEEKVDEIASVDEGCARGIKMKVKKNRKRKKQHLQNIKESNTEVVQSVYDEEKVDKITSVDEDCTSGMKKKVKKDRNCKKQHLQNIKERNTEVVQSVYDEEKVDEITSVDEDCTRGMKKWLKQYKESRPGLEVLQQRIDEFVTAHEECLEQEKKEREALAAEGGWTVVVHHKGRKKTTDAETGTAVGSVASAAVMDKMSKKKAKFALDFYRFQKREAKMNEIMMLQSRFEQDKKRIQQLRAARKFRPY